MVETDLAQPDHHWNFLHQLELRGQDRWLIRWENPILDSVSFVVHSDRKANFVYLFWARAVTRSLGLNNIHECLESFIKKFNFRFWWRISSHRKAFDVCLWFTSRRGNQAVQRNERSILKKIVVAKIWSLIISFLPRKRIFNQIHPSNHHRISPCDKRPKMILLISLTYEEVSIKIRYFYVRLPEEIKTRSIWIMSIFANSDWLFLLVCKPWESGPFKNVFIQ